MECLMWHSFCIIYIDASTGMSVMRTIITAHGEGVDVKQYLCNSLGFSCFYVLVHFAILIRQLQNLLNYYCMFIHFCVVSPALLLSHWVMEYGHIHSVCVVLAFRSWLKTRFLLWLISFVELFRVFLDCLLVSDWTRLAVEFGFQKTDAFCFFTVML